MDGYQTTENLDMAFSDEDLRLRYVPLQMMGTEQHLTNDDLFRDTVPAWQSQPVFGYPFANPPSDVQLRERYTAVGAKNVSAITADQLAKLRARNVLQQVKRK